MTGQFWLGLLALPIVVIACALALWVLSLVSATIEAAAERHKPGIYRQKRYRVERDGELRGYETNMGRIASIFAAFAINTRLLILRPLPGIDILVRFGGYSDPAKIRLRLEYALATTLREFDYEIPTTEKTKESDHA